MLSWDEFDRELRDEYAIFSSHRQRDKYNVHETSLVSGDSQAIRRAKAALDALDVAENLAVLEPSQYQRSVVLHTVSRRYLSSIKMACEGVNVLYDFEDDHAHKTKLRDSFNRIVLIFAAYLLSSIFCSLAAAARNAKLRTPLFAYDAELSVDRHRLRTAF